jgi:hypothetical protein
MVNFYCCVPSRQPRDKRIGGGGAARRGGLAVHTAHQQCPGATQHSPAGRRSRRHGRATAADVHGKGSREAMSGWLARGSCSGFWGPTCFRQPHFITKAPSPLPHHHPHI